MVQSGASLLAEVRELNLNPNFQNFSSPDPSDSRLGSEQSRTELASSPRPFSPGLPGTFLYNSNVSTMRRQATRKGHGYCDWTDHGATPWLTCNGSGPDGCDCPVRAKSLILHSPCCWSDAKWNATSSTHDAHIWVLPLRGRNLEIAGVRGAEAQSYSCKVN
jgi:hypothetical protein